MALVGAAQGGNWEPELLVLEACSQDILVILDQNLIRVSKCFSSHNRSSAQSSDGNVGSRAMGFPPEGLIEADIDSGRGG